MEMCYDGTLVMPSSYAVMSDEEMTYVEGGKAKVQTAANWINAGISAVLAAVGIGFGIGSILWFIKNSVKGLVVASLNLAIKSVCASLGFSIASGIYGILSSLNSKWTIGYGLAKYWDKHESGKKKSNGYVMG